MKRNNWYGATSVKSSIEYLASIYNTADQDTKDAIAVYFTEISGCLDCDNDKAKEETVDFVKRSLVDEEGQSLCPEQE
jgi:hypothetical protein